MTEQVGERIRLTEYQFVVCLLAATARKYTAFLAPRSDTEHAIDAAAAVAWKYMRQHDGGKVDYRFSIYTHQYYRHSETWQGELGVCEYHDLVTLVQLGSYEPYWYRLNYERLQSLAATFPLDQELWDSVARVFIDTINQENPFALVGAPMSW